jgi:exopolysaccharide biosynthesis WecB/TagA/CpsF family protein/anti-anti-sigma factor
MWTEERTIGATPASAFNNGNGGGGPPGKISRLTAPPVALLGVVFDNITAAETLARIDQMIASRRPHYIVTANVDFLAQARRDAELRRILLDADLVLCDGTPLVWASRLLDNPLPERVAGSDLMPHLLNAAVRKKYRLFFLGATAEANEQAAVNVRAQFSEVIIAGHYSPPFRPLAEMDNGEIVRRIRAARPDVLFVAFGCPKAEKWMAMNYRALGVPVTIGVGATIDFLAGRVKRAPLWMRRAGVEWVFRLWQEPRRLFKRYLGDLRIFAGAMFAQFLVMRLWRFARCAGMRTLPILVGPAWQRVRAPARLDKTSISQDAKMWEMLAGDDRHCLLELDDVKFIDSAGMAILVRLQYQLRTRGQRLILLSPSTVIYRALGLMRWAAFFEIANNRAEAHRLIQTDVEKRRMPMRAGMRCPLIWRRKITAGNPVDTWEITREKSVA